jgi:signal recognition particle subunit SRP54
VTDNGIGISKEFINRITERAVGEEVLKSLTPAQQVIKIVHEELALIMGGENPNEGRVKFSSKPPTIIMLCGLQGAGKTTHAAKLAAYFKKMDKRPLLVACDIYRPAAIDQLKVVGEKAQVPVFSLEGAKPVKIAKEAIKHAKTYGNDLVILDTAGRLHIDEELMDELKDIKKTVEPQEILLVIDSMTGQDAVNVAKSFNEQLEIDGVILTKLDGDTRGGAAMSVRYITGKPIKFTGVGEKLDELEPFYPDRMANRILGMGDVMSLIEKAQETYDAKQAEKLEKKLQKNKFDLNDLMDQYEQMTKMGSLEKIMGSIGIKKEDMDKADVDNQKIVRQLAILRSMTYAERENPNLLNASRRRRIAAGSGTKVEEVNRVIKTYDQMKVMLKRFNKNPKAMQNMLGGMGGGFGF